MKRPVRISQTWEKTGFGDHTWHLTIVGWVETADLVGYDTWLLLGRNVLGEPYLITLNEKGVRREARCVFDPADYS